MAKVKNNYFGPKKDRYNNVAILLHWLLAIAILFMFVLGWYMHELPKGGPKVSSFDLFDLGLITFETSKEISIRTFYFNLHKSIGVTIFFLVLFRIYWRLTHKPPKMLSSMSAFEIKLATAAHHALYLLMFLIPLSGIIMSIGSKYGIHWFGIPFLPGIDNETLRDLFKEFHEIFGQILLLFFILHFAGALKHTLFNKDGVLKRMWFHK